MTTTTRSARIPLIRREDHRHIAFANRLAAGGSKGFFSVPPTITAAIRRVVVLDDSQAAAYGEQRRLEVAAEQGEAAAIKAALDAAGAGVDPGEVEAEVVAAEGQSPRFKRRAGILARALTAAQSELVDVIATEAPATWQALEDALAETLAEAAPDAPVVLAGISSWTDPAALERSPDPVRAAFHRLAAAAERHDAIRGTAIAAYKLYTSNDAPWPPVLERIRTFAGGGIELTFAGGFLADGQPATDQIQRVEYRPEGHPVQRLAIAATAVPVAPLG